ncbi:GntR family transcriptional regulator [Solwaraspora sp. WMMD1047]|uniref:GntR family transcriptional regulator n=1 Tax=Solwaraspora sp. WMMD1047 TaxID=3016102 RepID=UPI002415E9AB|nr:GntR family transcriptional regulator [Solwaraspora sp. WMMD1047]MDG4832785.1 GntR family transcriptional regulator [Solwaraspora sp. WMMD1047]
MLLRLDPRDRRPLHEQVASGLRRAIAAGDYPPGARLPPARDIAAVLDLNPNTVLRAVRDLRDEGLLEFRRGRGITVRAGMDSHSAFLERLRSFLRDADRAGYPPPEIIRLIEEMT